MYANGRAKGPGRWYRSGLAVGRPKGVKPLPLNLQVLPMRMTPTSRNPGCVTTRTQYGLQVVMEQWEPRLFKAGKGLQRSPAKYRVECDGRTFYTDDAMYGLAFVRAAQHYRIRLDASLTEE